jgi:hypothetical protein
MHLSGVLTRRIDRFEAAKGSVSICTENLRRLGIRVCSFEDLTVNTDAPIKLRDATLGRVLDAIVERNPGYVWDEPKDGLINLFPAKSVLDSPVPAVVVRSKNARHVLEQDLRIEAQGIFFFEELSGPDDCSIDLALEHTNLRSALNTIVFQLGPLVWHIAGRPGAYFLSFTSVPQL